MGVPEPVRILNIQWLNTASGTFTLKAEWDGNNEYPRIKATTTLSSHPYQDQNIFFIESNSTVTALTFNSTKSKLIFTVSGPSGTNGYVKATIPKDMLPAEGNWTVLVDGNPVIPTIDEDANKTYIHFTYGHSTKTIKIQGTYAIPEFPSIIFLPLFLMATLLVTFYRKRFKQNTTR